MYMNIGDKTAGAIVAIILLWATVIIGGIAAWITHVAVMIDYLMNQSVETGYVIFLAIGAIVPPVGVIHGIGIWFGAW